MSKRKTLGGKHLEALLLGFVNGLQNKETELFPFSDSLLQRHFRLNSKWPLFQKGITLFSNPIPFLLTARERKNDQMNYSLLHHLS